MARIQARIKFWPSLSMALILALFLQLSSWQWHRYHQKLALQAAYQAQLHAPEQPLSEALKKVVVSMPVFTAVSLEGHYDSEHSIVLDNRSQQGQAGYEIFTPLRLNAEQALLIDRGFIAVGQHWHDLPDLSVTTVKLTLKGFLSRPQQTFSLGPAIEPTVVAWPLRAARLDIALLQKHYTYSLLPYIVLLKPSQVGSYQCLWSYPALFAERSLGYTFQWLALALVTFVLWVIISFKRIKSDA